MTPTARAAWTLRLGASFVNGERSTIDIPTVDSFDCLISFGVIRHFNKGEAPRLSVIPTSHDIHSVNCTVWLKQ
jgi:hypothetical protein